MSTLKSNGNLTQSPSIQHATPSVLLIFIGNPGRGDDGVAYYLHQQIEIDQQWRQWESLVETCWYFQLCPEQVYDLVNRSIVIFIDADAGFQQGIRLTKIPAQTDPVIYSHSVPPDALLGLYEQAFQRASPEAWLLSIGSLSFELGAGLTSIAQQNLTLAKDALKKAIANRENGLTTDPA